MMSLGLPDIIVTVAALAAAGVFARRVLGWGRAKTPSCPSCDSGACAPADKPGADAEPKPLTFIRRK